jgi:hypothetical protein
MEQGGDYSNVKLTFEKLEFYQILKVYKYFSWADKKLHQVFYIENKDDISEDLLSDFKDPDNEAKFRRPALNKHASQQEQKPQNVIVKSDSLLSEHEYLFGKKKDTTKIIDMKSSEDFPTLFAAGPGSNVGTQVAAGNTNIKKGQPQK